MKTDIDIKDICFFVRKETSCGLNDAKRYIESLIEAIKHSPTYRTDSTLELAYKEPINKIKVDELATEFANSMPYRKMSNEWISCYTSFCKGYYVGHGETIEK